MKMMCVDPTRLERPRETWGTASKRGSGPALLWFLLRQEAADDGQASGFCGLISISLSQHWPKVDFTG